MRRRAIALIAVLALVAVGAVVLQLVRIGRSDAQRIEQLLEQLDGLELEYAMIVIGQRVRGRPERPDPLPRIYDRAEPVMNELDVLLARRERMLLDVGNYRKRADGPLAADCRRLREKNKR